MRGSHGDCPRTIDTSDEQTRFQTIKTASPAFLNAVYCSGLRFKKRKKEITPVIDILCQLLHDRQNVVKFLVFCVLLLSLEGVQAGDEIVIKESENQLLNGNYLNF